MTEKNFEGLLGLRNKKKKPLDVIWKNLLQCPPLWSIYYHEFFFHTSLFEALNVLKARIVGEYSEEFVIQAYEEMRQFVLSLCKIADAYNADSSVSTFVKIRSEIESISQMQLTHYNILVSVLCYEGQSKFLHSFERLKTTFDLILKNNHLFYFPKIRTSIQAQYVTMKRLLDAYDTACECDTDLIIFMIAYDAIDFIKANCDSQQIMEFA